MSGAYRSEGHGGEGSAVFDSLEVLVAIHRTHDKCHGRTIRRDVCIRAPSDSVEIGGRHAS